MEKKQSISRRKFVRSSTLISTTLLGAPALASCKKETPEIPLDEESYPFYSGQAMLSEDHVAGLLFSRVGYDTGQPLRVILRFPGREDLPSKASCQLKTADGVKIKETGCEYWGELWGSHWWVAHFKDIQDAGKWLVEIRAEDGSLIFRDRWVEAGDQILWNRTLEWAAADMLERRVHFTKVGAGWQDAGTLWVESCAQSAMVIGLEELLEQGTEKLDEDMQERIFSQIMVGCDYLVMLQEKARELGFPEGAMSHDLHGHEKDIMPNDATKAIVALWKAVRLLPDRFEEKKKIYDLTARKAYDWLKEVAKPMGDYGLSRFQRGIDENTAIPDNEWQTRDLLMLCQGALEKFRNGDASAQAHCIELADQVSRRQIKKDAPESGFYGHFREYDSLPHTEKAWSHGIVNNEFGADMGGVYPHYLMPVIEMLKLWPGHEKAPTWKSMLENFTYGYLIPVTEKNPFLILPLGIFGNEGPIWFCGTFHGTNAIYGYAAALALELSAVFNEPRLREIAYGNLQWLAGLNGGITRKNLINGCVIFSTDLPEGFALPASMICHIGDRWAGTWFQTRGVICNGFTTGAQFRYDVAPVKKNDGPFSLTDEDWIPHSAAWLTGLVRL